MTKRHPRDRQKLGLLERLMFSVMGPPQLGDVNAPVAERAERPAELCTQCHTAVDGHEIVRDPGLTYMRCPSD